MTIRASISFPDDSALARVHAASDDPRPFSQRLNDLVCRYETLAAASTPQGLLQAEWRALTGAKFAPLYADASQAEHVAVRVLSDASRRADVQEHNPEAVAHGLLALLTRMMVTLYHHTPQSIASMVLTLAEREANTI